MATASVTVKTTAGAFNKVEAGGKQHYFISRLLRAPHSRPVGERGVQLRVLKDLERYAVECCGPQPKSEEPTCRQVHDIIKELTQTQSGTCSLAELLPLEEGAPTKLVGVPEFYVSFRWTMPFTKIVEAVSHVVKAHYAERGRAEGTANDALVYLSLTALDRSAGWSVIWNDVTEVIQRTKHLIFVMDPDQEALTRLWMLWELATRAKAAADDGDDSASALLIFVGDMKFQHIQQLLHKLRDGSITGAGPAKASSPEDEALLKDTIKAQWGEYEKFATFVSNKVAEALPASLRLGAERFLSGDKPAVKPINERAVSVAWLKGFRDRVVAAADIGPDATTRDVVDKMVKTRTRDAKIAFYQLQDERELQSSMGRARYFISHAWDAKFSDVVDAAADAVTMLEPEADLRSVHVWVDIFAITQHRVANQDADLSHLGVCVRASEKGTILCLDTSGMALTRAWCLYEVWLTLLEGGDGSKQQQQHLGGLTSAPSTADAASAAALAAELRVAEDASSSSASASRLHVALQGVDVTLAGIRRMLDSLDVTTAGAFHKEDRWTILEKVARTTGFRRLNALIKQAVINSTVRTVEALCK